MNIIQTWKNNNIPNKFKECIRSVFHHNKDFKYLFFTDDDIDIFIKTKMPQYKEKFYSFKTTIQRIDFFRYLAIYYYGGIYLDIDIIIERELDELYKNPDICKFPLEYIHIIEPIITDQNYEHLIGNYAFYAPAGHPFIKKIIDNIMNTRFNNNDISKAMKSKYYSSKDIEIYCTTGHLMVTQSYIDMENKKSVYLLSSRPFRNERFGMYGKHLCSGLWRNL